MTHRLFTLGHSILEAPKFLEALQRHGVTLLVDVRSKPQSQRHQQFDRIELEQSLAAGGIRYLFLGDELGGRPEDPKAYRSDGLVNYQRWRKSRAFLAGIKRLQTELAHDDLALMCAEEDPITCHRFLMICPELVAAGIDPQHIRKGAALETQSHAEDRLLHHQNLSAFAGDTLFSSDRSAALENAYIAQSEKCAFRIDPQVLEPW